MSWFVNVYRVLFLLHFILYESDGKITSPPDGTNITIVPGGNGSIIWKFDDEISTLGSRTWTFTSTDGLRSSPLGGITLNLDLGLQPGILPGISITKPATLVLNNVNQSYDGTYTFTLSTTATFTSSVRVFIAKKSTVTLNCASVTVNEGDDFICECKGLAGNPPANVTWYKDDNQIGETGTEKQLLTLINVDETDSGTYKCVSESYPDPNYKDEKSITLNVRFGPKDTSIQLNPNPVTLGQSFIITCSSRGFPEPTYKIFFNGSRLIDAETYTINNVERSDAGVYECSAENGVGPTDKVSRTLGVAERESTTQEPSTPNTREKNIPNGSGETCTCSKLGCDSSGTAVVWHIVVSLLSGIIIGILFSYIVSCSRRRWSRNRKPERNSAPQKDGVDTTYQELDLTKMNKEDNYQSLTGNVAVSASNDAANDEESTYTQLSKIRDVENNYQSLT